MSVWLVCRLVRDKELAKMTVRPRVAARAAKGWNSPCPPGEYLDLDKAWAGLSWLLTGDVDADEPWPAAGAVMGGTWLGREPDTVLGLTSSQVAEVADYLKAVSFDQLWAQLGPESLAALMDYDQADPPDTVEEYERYLREWYTTLVAFFAQAAQRGMAMVKIIVA